MAPAGLDTDGSTAAADIPKRCDGDTPDHGPAGEIDRRSNSFLCEPVRFVTDDHLVVDEYPILLPISEDGDQVGQILVYVRTTRETLLALVTGGTFRREFHFLFGKADARMSGN